jgi:hypothetical protein
MQSFTDVELGEWNKMRNLWALSATVSQSCINMQRQHDRDANPYNEDRTGKPKIRSEAEIVSDIRYQFADQALTHQFSSVYTDFLKSSGYIEIRGFYRLSV